MYDDGKHDSHEDESRVEVYEDPVRLFLIESVTFCQVHDQERDIKREHRGDGGDEPYRCDDRSEVTGIRDQHGDGEDSEEVDPAEGALNERVHCDHREGAIRKPEYVVRQQGNTLAQNGRSRNTEVVRE